MQAWSWKPVRVTFRCAYPESDGGPTEETFVPPPEWGDTPEAVHAHVTELLSACMEGLELPNGDRLRFPFTRDAVRQVVVR